MHSLAHKADAANVQERTADSCDAPAMELSLQGCMSFKWKTYTYSYIDMTAFNAIRFTEHSQHVFPPPLHSQIFSS